MTHYDDALRQLHEQVARYNQLSAQIPELENRRERLLQKIAQLEQAKEKEQHDVDRLEGNSLAAFFYHVIGKKDEKLDEERREAYAARVKYDAAVFELRAVEADLAACQEVWDGLQGCQARYDGALQEKTAQIKESGGIHAEQILGFEERLASLKNQERELREALAAGEKALQIADQVKSSLDSAKDYATWDVMGGGILADINKYNAIDEAQESVNLLQAQLVKFRMEMADVSNRANIQISVDDFSRFADYYFDNLFTDWVVMDEINRAQNQLQDTYQKLQTATENLSQRHKAVADARTTLQQQLESLILEV